MQRPEKPTKATTRYTPMGRVHTRKKFIGRLGGDDYSGNSPKDAERQIGCNFYKRGLNNKIFIWRGEWLRCITVSDKEWDKAKELKNKTTLAKINEDLLKRIEVSK